MLTGGDIEGTPENWGTRSDTGLLKRREPEAKFPELN